MIEVITRRSFPDAARYELSKVISAHDKHHWLSMSYKGDLSQLWQNRAFCDKFCDKTVAQNCIRCDKVINISGWRKKTALLQSSEMCHDKVIFSPLKTRLFYLETFQFHLLFPALISEHFTIYFYHFGQVFSLIGISNTWTRPDKQLIFFLQPEYFFTLNSEIQQRIDSQSRKFENCERLMRKPCFPRLFLFFNIRCWTDPNPSFFVAFSHKSACQ